MFYNISPDENLWLPNQVSLTFDDGVSEYTEALSHYLRDEGIPATFFIVAGNTIDKKCEKVLSLIRDDGHVIGNHTFNHPICTAIRTDAVLKEIRSNDDYLDKFLPQSNRLFRAPYGEWNSKCDTEVLSRLSNYYPKNIGWHRWARDWEINVKESNWSIEDAFNEVFFSGDRRYKNTIPRSNPHGVILLHDGCVPQILELTKKLVVKMRELQMEFVSLTDTLLKPLKVGSSDTCKCKLED
jgi:peptidoglycan/xylan/chitin deacetylase (PgdA/CDA1 family)